MENEDDLKFLTTQILILICVMLLIMICIGCRTVTRTEYVPVTEKVVETVTLHDTAVIAPLPLSHDTLSVQDTVSYLSNSFAYSWARYQGGTLSHSLGVFPGAQLVVTVPHYEVRERTVEKPVIETKEVQVEKSLTFWQKFKLFAGETLLLLVVGLAGYVFFLKCKKGGVL